MVANMFASLYLYAEKVLFTGQEHINGGRGEERVTLHSHCRNSRISRVLLCRELPAIHRALLSRCVIVEQA